MVFFKRLLQESQIHGPKRMVEKRYRYIWAVSLIMFLHFTFCIIAISIERYLENPTYVAIVEKKFTHMRFPSLVICPEVEYPDDKIKMFLETIDFPPGLNATNLPKVVRQLAAFYAPDVVYSAHELNAAELLLNYNSLTFEAAAKRLTPSCEESLLRCRLFGDVVNCTDLFTMFLTKSGYCCVFNGRSMKREMLDGVQSSQPPLLQTTVYNHMSSLFVIVNTTYTYYDLDLNYKWAYVTKGQSYVESGVNGTPISPATETWFEYRQKQFVIDDEVKRLTSKLRRCRMSTDRLQYFPIYTRRYCLVECEAARTLRRCNCVAAPHPRPVQAYNCRARSLLCERNSAVTFDSPFCDCPATCDSSSDEYKTYSFPLFPGSYYSDELYKNLDLSKVAVIRAYMLPNQPYSKRRAVFTPINLFSQIGGVFSVFFGFSILSLLELIQLVWYGYKEYRISRKLNRPAQLILPPPPLNKKIRKKKNKKN